uniref:Uncharacterized protein n=1 Tax=Oryza barthii TaxID=65489 RepID=A0A0D3FZA2_9ORYZ
MAILEPMCSDLNHLPQAERNLLVRSSLLGLRNSELRHPAQLDTSFNQGIQDTGIELPLPMKGAARFVVENATRQIKPVNGLPRLMTITTPQKHGKENNSNDSVLTKDENIEPLVAFSRPPPLPPVLGPLIMLSLFNISSGGDENKN